MDLHEQICQSEKTDFLLKKLERLIGDLSSRNLFETIGQLRAKSAIFVYQGENWTPNETRCSESQS